MIRAGIVDRVLVMGADTPLSVPSVAPGLPLSPERTRGVFWDFQGPFGVMGANSQFALVQTRYMHQYQIKPEHLGKIAVTTRYQHGITRLLIPAPSIVSPSPWILLDSHLEHFFGLGSCLAARS